MDFRTETKHRAKEVTIHIAEIARFLREKISSVKEAMRIEGGTESINSGAILDNGFLLALREAAPSFLESTEPTRRLVWDVRTHFPKQRIVLLVAPAGTGKTSYCKFSALTDATALLKDRDSALPIFVPLSQFSNHTPASLDESFFRAPEVASMIKESPDTLMHLYLDGLDELPNARKQERIVELAFQAISKHPNLCVTITARTHIWGPWLTEIPRIQVDELTDIQQRQLVQHWLESTESTDAFFRELNKVEPLRRLMGTPFLATLICAIYRRHHTLPPNRCSLYSLFVDLLCGGWDAIKGVQRYSQFGSRDKRLVLTNLAFANHMAMRRDATDAELRSAISRCLRGHSDLWSEMRDELIGDCLLVSTGSGLRFSHLSFQEYLASEALRDRTGDRAKFALKSYFQGEDWWKEVLIYYVVASGNPPETEEWLIDRARRCVNSIPPTLVQNGILDDRLNCLRLALRESYPAFESRYTPDGITTEPTTVILNGNVHIKQLKRRLSGVFLPETAGEF